MNGPQGQVFQTVLFCYKTKAQNKSSHFLWPRYAMCTAGDTHNCTEGLFSRSNVCFSWLDSTQVEFWWIPYFLKLFVHVSKSHIIFSNLNSNSSNLIDLRNLQQQVKQAFRCQKLSRPFTVWINCSSDLNKFANSCPLDSNFQSFS